MNRTDMKTRKVRIVVVGVGGIGTNLADWVARYLATRGRKENREYILTLIDGDQFEPRNSERQSFRKLGNKAVVKRDELIALFPGLCVEVDSEYVTDELIDTQILSGDIVLLCVDNHKTRKRVSDFINRRLRSAVLISGGNEMTTGNVLTYVRKDGVNLSPPLTQNHPEIANPQDHSPDEVGCAELQAQGDTQSFQANLNVAVAMLNALCRYLDDPEGFISKPSGPGRHAKETAYTDVEIYPDYNAMIPRRYAVET